MQLTSVKSCDALVDLAHGDAGAAEPRRIGSVGWPSRKTRDGDEPCNQGACAIESGEWPQW